MKEVNLRIDGFRMHQSILEEFRFLKQESFSRPPASAYVVYLTMLKQLYLENNKRGILKEYNLADWAKSLNISYSTLYCGRKWLEDNYFVSEIIDPSGLPVLLMKDVEKYNKPEEGNTLNYLLIPHALFETNILAELVRTSNPEGIELMLSLLNQFRTGISLMREDSLEAVQMSRTMQTLKRQLNKNAKGVRQVLSLLEPLFHIKYEGLSLRGNQIWIRKVSISLKEECVQEKTDQFQVDQLMAMLSHELTYFLDGLRIRYKPRDQRDVMIAFNQEIVSKLKYLTDDGDHSFKRNSFIKEYFLTCMDKIAENLRRQLEHNPVYRWHSIGAVFRIFFRNQLKPALNSLPYGIIHDAKMSQHAEIGKMNIPF
jgi:hypothetical protein